MIKNEKIQQQYNKLWSDLWNKILCYDKKCCDIKKEIKHFEEKLAIIRQALADYMIAKGCGCCADHERKEVSLKILAHHLNVPRKDDDSGFKFYLFTSKNDLCNSKTGKE